MHYITIKIITMCLITLLYCNGKPVKAGADRLCTKYYKLIAGKRLGVITNHSAITRKGKHLIDTLLDCQGVIVKALYAPEHGITGTLTNGAPVTDTVNELNGLPVYSLYNELEQPSMTNIDDIDILIYDIQSIGVRFYTYESLLIACMEAATIHNKLLIILDRPNPLTGITVDGPLLDKKYTSLVAMVPVPIRHGLTIGEFALMANKQHWLKNNLQADIVIIPLKYWQRSMWYDTTQLAWVKPSPNITTPITALVYSGTCLLEATNISEGRGTERPFECIGAPWIHAHTMSTWLNNQELPGVQFEPTSFIPQEIPGIALKPKYQNLLCHGINIYVTDRARYQAVKTGIALLECIYALYPKQLHIDNQRFDELMGTDIPRTLLKHKKKTTEIVAYWQQELDKFKSLRQHYFLY